jgi:hypothetical protein
MYQERKLLIVLNTLLFVLIFFFPQFFLAQTNSDITTSRDAVYGSSEVDVLYTHTSSANIFVHTQGGGISLSYGKYLTSRLSRSIAADILFIKHEKEERSSNPVHPEGLPYVFGKLNSFMSVRINSETRRELTPKLRSGGVQVGTVSRYGFSLGLLKPVYLVIGYPEIPYEYVQTERYDPEVHFYDDIYGRSPWVNGLDQIKFIPGAHLSYGLAFEYGNVRGSSKSLEIGSALDVFLSKVEIMTTQFVDPSRIFFTLYIKMGIGANWTQAR